ncbi:MAG: septum formation protein Maf [Sphingobium sp.]|nr:MAG: septum formation protein Maf [Sphingobium sp.]
MIVLASQSASRRAMLSAAGVPFEALTPGVDEEAAKEALRADGHDGRALADALAELKALKVSRRVPGALVLGCDQTLTLDDGTMIDKAVDKADAARILRLLSGRVHHLHSAAVIVLNNEPIWRHVERVRMTVRTLSVFARVEGSQFGIQGLPLLPLLDFLRIRGVLAS